MKESDTKIIKLTIDNIEIKYYNIGKDKGVVKLWNIMLLEI